MTNISFSRRRLIQSATAVLAVGAVPGIALANADSLLADILIGVGDAMKRDYIREHYGRGRWDGHYWHYEGRRYTPISRFLAVSLRAARSASAAASGTGPKP